MTEKNETPGTAPVSIPETSEYEAPLIETVITRDELEREVHYAGLPISAPVTP
jgi:hypothetical protein